MEAKKNPAADVHRKSFQFFCIGLIISISLAMMAFEWTSERKTRAPRHPDETIPDMIWMIPPTQIEVKAPEPIKKIVPAISPTHVNPTAIAETRSPDEPETELPIDLSSSSESALSLLPPEELDTIHVFPEQRPEPLLGMSGFYQMLGKNLHYPKAAQRQRVEGKVFVEFIIDQTGSPTQLKVMKGIGAGCDEEAMRVLALTQWKPGKQRGKPVKVKMVLPVTFQLRD